MTMDNLNQFNYIKDDFSKTFSKEISKSLGISADVYIVNGDYKISFDYNQNIYVKNSDGNYIGIKGDDNIKNIDKTILPKDIYGFDSKIDWEKIYKVYIENNGFEDNERNKLLFQQAMNIGWVFAKIEKEKESLEKNKYKADSLLLAQMSFNPFSVANSITMNSV